MVVRVFLPVVPVLVAVISTACQGHEPVQEPWVQAALQFGQEPAPAEGAATEVEEVPDGYTSEGKRLSIVNIAPIETLNDGVHDTENNAFMTLQDPTVALEGFPLDRRLQVNWVQALEMGLIEPRADITGKSEMLVMNLDIVMKNTKDMPYVRFPHLQHTKWLDCSNCHPNIFIPQENANDISMNKVLRGEYCGVCHDKVAFSLFTCERCHSVPHATSGKWW